MSDAIKAVGLFDFVKYSIVVYPAVAYLGLSFEFRTWHFIWLMVVSTVFSSFGYFHLTDTVIRIKRTTPQSKWSRVGQVDSFNALLVQRGKFGWFMIAVFLGVFFLAGLAFRSSARSLYALTSNLPNSEIALLLVFWGLIVISTTVATLASYALPEGKIIYKRLRALIPFGHP